MANKNQQYAEQYADYAMEQMRRYGIPASVTLAQGILESSNGQSELARKENNHFGIKATPEWIAEGGRYGLYSDDKPNEKFCSYDNAGDSYEHHSRFLKENSRYSRCFTLSPDDYKGWTQEIERAGYATGVGYAESLQKIIERNGLQEYDRQVMQEMKTQGKQFGAENNPLRNSGHTRDYSFPVERKEFLLVTSPFGVKEETQNGTQRMHTGIDIRCNSDGVLATERDGKVIAVNGKSVTVEYERKDGSKVQCTYMNLAEVSVKAGDTVQAGQRLGTTGRTGKQTSGEHLHFGVKYIYADGTQREVDPAAYLAEIAQKGAIKQQVLHNGNDLLAKYKDTGTVKNNTSLPRRMDEKAAFLGRQRRGTVGMQRPYRGYGNGRLHFPDGSGRANRPQERGRTESSDVRSDGAPENRPYVAVARHENLRPRNRRKRQGCPAS